LLDACPKNQQAAGQPLYSWGAMNNNKPPNGNGLIEDGSLPKATANKAAASLKQPENLPPLKVLAVLRRDIKHEFFQASPVAHASQALAPREVILSSYLFQSP
jgi:hypothetical protein